MSFLFAVLVGSTSALTLPTASTNQAHGIASRRSFLANGASAALAVAAVAGGAAQPAFAEDLGDGLTYTVVTKGKGSGQPKIGDLIVVRFKSTVVKSGQVIDDIMANPEGYYYRVGSGQVLPCVEKAVVQMKTGDVWRMTVPPELGFGKAGRSASPGKPRIPGDAVLDFTLELVAVPGKDDEIIELNDVDLDAK